MCEGTFRLSSTINTGPASYAWKASWQHQEAKGRAGKGRAQAQNTWAAATKPAVTATPAVQLCQDTPHACSPDSCSFLSLPLPHIRVDKRSRGQTHACPALCWLWAWEKTGWTVLLYHEPRPCATAEFQCHPSHIGFLRAGISDDGPQLAHEKSNGSI